MTTDPHGVRKARFELARALAATGEKGHLTEAQQQLLLALADATGREDASDSDPDGTSPMRWEILSALSDLATQRRRPRDALTYLVEAVIAAPPPQDGILADRALHSLESDPRLDARDAVPPSLLEALQEAARDTRHDERVAWLAAGVALVRGQVGLARDLTRKRQRVEHTPETEGLRAATVAAEVIELIADGRTEEAEEHLRPLQSKQADASVGLARGLMRYAQGDLDGARHLLEPYADAGDPAEVVVLCLLLEAAQNPNGRAGLHTQARTAAARAARADPEGGEPMLLRAQVQLEGGNDVPAGRELLQTALGRIPDPQRLPWWRIQDRVRHDELYAYFRVELAAAQQHWQDVRTWAERYSRATTTYAQDAAVEHMWALASSEPVEGAGHWTEAVAAYRAAEDLPGATGAAREAYRLRPDPETGLQMAQVLWERSFAADSDDDPRRLVSEAQAVLDTLEGEHDPAILAQVCLTWGLLLFREDVLAVEAGVPWAPQMSWRPLPHLLLSAFLDPSASYTWAHAAWACNQADLQWPMLWTAERALELRPVDDWLQETHTVAYLNWFGVMDEPSRTWLSEAESRYADPEWVRAVQGFDALLRGERAAAAELLSGSSFDAWWVREGQASARVLAESFEAAQPLLTELLEESRGKEDWFDAGLLALLLDPTLATDVLGRIGVPRDGPTPWQQVIFGLLELVTSRGEDGREGLLRGLERMRRPVGLRQARFVRFPMMAVAHPVLAAGLEDARSRCAELLVELEMRPKLAAEVLSGDSWCADPDLGLVVHRLLEGADAGAPPASDPPPGIGGLRGGATLRAAWSAYASGSG